MSENYTNRNADTYVSNNLSKFYGFYSNPYKDPLVTGTAFIFMTRPALFLNPNRPHSTKDTNLRLSWLNMTKDPYFNQFLVDQVLNSNDSAIINSLSYEVVTNTFSSSFLPIITNECKSFDTTDVTMETNEVFDTKQGYRQPLPSHKTASEASGSFSIEVTEDNNMSFTKMMTIWVNYISNITDGTFDANPDAILNGELDYTCSLYYFLLEPDGRTLKYWCRYTGCWPNSIPYSALRYSKGTSEAVDLTLQFSYTNKEDMNPRILEDFNAVSLKLASNEKIPSVGVNGYYASIKESPLLNRNNMIDTLTNVSNILTSEERDPLIFYKENSSKGILSDDTKAHFELLFDDFGYKSDFIDDIFADEGLDNNYFINDSATNDYAKTGETTNWDLSGFWGDE